MPKAAERVCVGRAVIIHPIAAPWERRHLAGTWWPERFKFAGRMPALRRNLTIAETPLLARRWLVLLGMLVRRMLLGRVFRGLCLSLRVGFLRLFFRALATRESQG